MRIALAVAIKDVLDLVKNRTIMGVIIGVVILFITMQVFPLLIRLSGQQVLVLYDPHRSSFIVDLRRQSEITVHLAHDIETVRTVLLEANTPALGLVVTENTEDHIQLDSYAVYWASDAEITALIDSFETQMTELTGRSIEINRDPIPIYPTEEIGGYIDRVAMTTIIILSTIVLSIVPYLIIEEKNSRTMDILLLSPATMNQVLLGKIMASQFYGVIATIIVLSLYSGLIIHWLPALITAIAIIALSAILGLLMGLLLDEQAAMPLWMGAAMLFLLAPLLISILEISNLPPLLESLLPYLPTVGLKELFRMSMQLNVEWPQFLLNLLPTAISILVLYALSLWRLRVLAQR